MELATLIISLVGKAITVGENILRHYSDDAASARTHLDAVIRAMDLAEARALGRLAGNDAEIDAAIEALREKIRAAHP